MIRTARLALMSIGLIASSGNAHSQQCDIILKEGPFREENIKSSEAFANEFVDMLCNSNENSTSRSRKAGLRIPIVNLPIGADYVGTDGNINRSVACKNKSNKSSDDIQKDIFKKYADPDLLKTFLACNEIFVDNSATGLVCKAQATEDDPTQVKVTVNWRPTNISQNIELNAETLNLSCQGFLQPSFAMRPYDARVFLCSRPDTTKSAAVVINTNAASTKCDVSVPAISIPNQQDMIRSCFKNIANKFPAGVSGNIRAIAQQRCCQQMQIFQQDIAISKLAEKQWSICVEMYNGGKTEIGDICVKANSLPGYGPTESLNILAQRGLNDAVMRRTITEGNLEGSNAMCSSD